MTTRAESILARFERAKGDRILWDQHWETVARLVLPTRNFTSAHVPGRQLRGEIFNDTAPHAHQSLSAATHGLLFNPAIPWFALAPSDPGEKLSLDEKAWIFDATRRMLDYFNSTRSAFATESSEIVQDLVAFGTGVLLARESRGWLSYQARQLANFWMRDDDFGRIVEQYCAHEIAAHEVVKRWGENAVSPETLKKAKDDKQCDERIIIVHCVYERAALGEAYDIDRRDGPNKPWGSVYVEQEAKHVLGVSGFDENPFIVPRWGKAPQEVYGRSPAMHALPAIQCANAMSRTVLIAGEQAVSPSLLVPANSMEGPIRTAPRSINYTKPGTSEFPRPLVTGAQPLVGHELIERVEKTIEEFFFLDAFRLPELDRMTAEEVITRRQQGLLTASPTISRLQSELLAPIIKRHLRWLRRTGRIAPPPDSMRGMPLTIEYRSPMALSQRASEGQNFLQAMATATPLINADPGLMIEIDGSYALRAIFDNNNVDPRFMRNPRIVEALRRQQQQTIAAQQQAMIAKDAAQAVRDTAAGLSDARTMNAA